MSAQPEEDGVETVLPEEEDTLPGQVLGKRAAEEPDEEAGETPEGYETINAPPTSECVKLKQHRKIVSGMDIDRSGSRLVTISHDYTMALWDFAGMDSTLKPFRFVTPISGCPLRGVRFSPAGELLAVIGGGTMKLVDRHGGRLAEYPKGDPYLKDLKRTVGHVGNILAVDWDPHMRDRLLSAGQDGTVRVWLGESKRMREILVIKPLRGGRAPAVTQLKFVPDSHLFAVAATDGMIRFYPDKGPWLKPTLVRARGAFYGH